MIDPHIRLAIEHSGTMNEFLSDHSYKLKNMILTGEEVLEILEHFEYTEAPGLEIEFDNLTEKKEELEGKLDNLNIRHQELRDNVKNSAHKYLDLREDYKTLRETIKKELRGYKGEFVDRIQRIIKT